MIQRLFLILIVSFLWSGCQQIEKAPEYPLGDFDKWQRDNPYFRAALISLHYMTETMAVEKLDSIYKGIQQSYNLPVVPRQMPDGVYRASSPYDAFDYNHTITLEIKNGKLIGVNYDEIHRNGHSKRDDTDYAKSMKMAGTTPDSAYANMEKQLLEKQDLTQVDAVSGATYSKFRFTYAGYLALMKAAMKRREATN